MTQQDEARRAQPGPVGSLLFSLLVPSCLMAQAWVFPKGEGAVSLSYQNLYVTHHVDSTGLALDRGHIFADSVSLDVEYSLTNRLAARVSLPYVASSYVGDHPHTWLDNGDYHSTFQDYGVDVRYNVSQRPLVITPFFRAVIPSHSYEYFAHSAVGMRLHEYHLGTNVGRRLNPFLPKGYVQASYSYAFVERIVGIAPNRSDVEFQVGYFLKPRFSLSGTGHWMHTHSGVDLLSGVPNGGLTDEQWPHHDQIAKARLFDLDGGAALAVNPSLQILVSVARSLTGVNGHFHAAVVTVALSRTFGNRFGVEKAALGPAGESVPPPGGPGPKAP